MTRGAALLLLWSWGAGSAAAAKEAPNSVVLRWSSVMGAITYQLQIAPTENFKSPVVDERLRVAKFRWSIIPAKAHYWRVRGMDRHQRWGKWSPPRKIAAIRVPPDLNKPTSGARFTWRTQAPEVALRWEKRPGISRYRVEVARSPTFRTLVLKRTVETNSTIVQASALGDHHWRVVSIDGRGQASLPSRARRFRVVPGSPSWAPGGNFREQRVGESHTFRWKPATWAAATHLEMAHDRAFQELVARVEVHGSEFTWSAPQAGTVFVRIGARQRNISRVSPVVEVRMIHHKPQLLSPADGAVLTDETTTLLSWQQASVDSRFLVEVSTDPHFASLSHSFQVSGDRVAVPELRPGVYHWRVRYEPQNTVADGVSSYRSFTVRPAVVAEVLPPPPPLPSLPGAQGFVGVHAGLSPSPEILSSTRLGLDFSQRWKLPFGRLGFLVHGGYLRQTQQLDSNGTSGQLQAEVHQIPLGALALYELPSFLDPWVFYGGLGMHFQAVYAQVRGERIDNYAAASVSVGGEIRTGVEYPFLWGRLFGQLGYVLVTHRSGFVSLNPSGLWLDVGYRVTMW